MSRHPEKALTALDQGVESSRQSVPPLSNRGALTPSATADGQFDCAPEAICATTHAKQTFARNGPKLVRYSAVRKAIGLCAILIEAEAIKAPQTTTWTQTETMPTQARNNFTYLCTAGRQHVMLSRPAQQPRVEEQQLLGHI